MLENTESQEMYLTTIYALQKKNGMVRSVDVADERGYSKVSVHNAMKRLEEFGYVTFHQGKITLTKCGIEKVKNIKQKHHFPLHKRKHLLKDLRKRFVLTKRRAFQSILFRLIRAEGVTVHLFITWTLLNAR